MQDAEYRARNTDKKKLRSGYTTGACAAAAAKAAVMILLQRQEAKEQSANLSLVTHLASLPEVEIPFPDGSRHKFRVQSAKCKVEGTNFIAMASVIKDAGDDPDVTNQAEIVATVKAIGEKLKARAENRGNSLSYQFLSSTPNLLLIKGGKGVGIITKPGLSMPIGEAAINPVPRRMIGEAVREAIKENTEHRTQNTDKNNLGPGPWALSSAIEITISVTDGEEIAKKTLNPRLGIIGGISILGTTGIVRPISTEAWTATITSSMDVAKAMGHAEIVLSAGRTSERAHMKVFHLSEESYVMMGDYLEFSLKEAKRHEFKKIHLCAQWAKMLKIAMATPQTHVRHGAIDVKKAAKFLEGLEIGDWGLGKEFNTAREIYDFINSELKTQSSKLFKAVCNASKNYAETITGGVQVIIYLISYEGEVIASSE